MIPSLPTTPFRWPNGLVELPCPVVRAGGLGLPYLGGVYLRALPAPASAWPAAGVGARQLLWIYCHPYDFDPDETFWVVPEAGRLGSRLLWYNRRRTFAKIEAALRGRAGPPLAERLDGGVAAHDRRDFSQLEMVHRLPPASLVDRFDYLRVLATGRRVVHVGFVDAGCQSLNEQSGAWLHEHLAASAQSSWWASTSTPPGSTTRAVAATRRTRSTVATSRR